MSKQYKNVIFEAVDEILEKTLGTTSKQVVYTYMQCRYKIDVERCDGNFEEFIKALREILGENTSMMIEKMVMKELCASINLNNINEDSSLRDLIKRLKKLKVKKTRDVGKGV